MLISTPKRLLITRQNFKKITPTLIWTLKLRSVWLYRNIFLLIFLRQSLILNVPQYWNLTHETNAMRYLANFLLLKKLHHLLTHIYLKTYTIVTSNFSRSCDYWTLTNGIVYLDQKQLNGEIFLQKVTKWNMHYIKSKQLVGVFTAKRIYKIELIKFIQLLIFNWQTLNSKRLYNSGYPIITVEWFLLRFLGTHYFKTLNF